MLTFISRRLLQSIVILLGLSVFFFFLVHVSPGGPCDKFLQAERGGPNASAKYEACAKALGINDPLPGQYWHWLTRVAHGDFGTSTTDNNSVWTDVSARIPATLLLAGIAYLVQQLLALPLGIYAALRRYSFFDNIFTVVSYVGLSLPTFFLAGIFIIVFSNVGLPAGGIVGDSAHIPPFNGPGYWSYFMGHPWHAATDFLSHLILPAAVLALTGIASDSRFMRSSMLEVINQDYIRTARAKGLRRRTVVLKHAARNALMPIITNIAIALPGLLGGAIITETIFGWPGLGELFYESLGAKNYAVLQLLLMIGAVGVLAGNLLGDLVYAWVDPRIRYD